MYGRETVINEIMVTVEVSVLSIALIFDYRSI